MKHGPYLPRISPELGVVCDLHPELIGLALYENGDVNNSIVEDRWKPLSYSGVITGRYRISDGGEARRYEDLAHHKIELVCNAHAPRNRKPLQLSHAVEDGVLMVAARVLAVAGARESLVTLAELRQMIQWVTEHERREPWTPGLARTQWLAARLRDMRAGTAHPSLTLG